MKAPDLDAFGCLIFNFRLFDIVIVILFVIRKMPCEFLIYFYDLFITIYMNKRSVFFAAMITRLVNDSLLATLSNGCSYDEFIHTS